ncbi:MAG: SRPBCC domain-containing protein [Myxococcota bacterium]
MNTESANERSVSTEARVERVSLFHRRIHSEILIDAPPDRVWRVLTDWERLREWSPTLLGMNGEIRHGQTVDCAYVFKGKEIAPKHTLHYEEGLELGWSDPMLPGVFDRHRYRIEPLSDGRTRFVQSDEVRGGVLSLLLGWFFVNEMVATYPAFNRALKTRVESLSADPVPGNVS